MVDVPRAPQPSDAERLDVLRRNMTPGNAFGESRAVGPIFRRDLAQAAVIGLGDSGSLDETGSKIDGPDELGYVTGTDNSTFQLTFDALDDSWNVSLNGVSLVDGVDYSIAGRTLTILNATSLFAGASVADPWTLQVQYDYLTGVPTAVSDTTSGPIVVGVPWFQYGSSEILCWWRMEGMAGFDVGTDLGAAFHDTFGGYQSSTFGNLGTGPQLAGAPWADNIYFGSLTRPWYGAAIMDGLQVSVPWDTTVLFDLPSPVSQHTTAPPSTYQG